MRRGEFRAAAVVAAVMALAAALVAWEHHLPLRDPDGASMPTWFRLPLIVGGAVLLDVAARWAIQARRGRTSLRAVVADRWHRDQIVFTLSGLVTWYVAYVAFRNLKNAVPFATDRIYDTELDNIDHALWLGHDPAVVLHDVLGTTWANWLTAAVYLIWIGLVPASLAVALVWTRRSSYGVWYVTAISVDWMLGAMLYYAVPSLGPTYSRPQWFASLPHTPNTSVRDTLLSDRVEVLAGPWDTHTVQTIAAFASLHVAVMVTLCLVLEVMRVPRVLRLAAWVFLGLTVLATVYLGWHFFVDTLAGAVVGVAAFVIAAVITGNPLRRRAEPWTFRTPAVEEPAPVEVDARRWSQPAGPASSSASRRRSP